MIEIETFTNSVMTHIKNIMALRDRTNDYTATQFMDAAGSTLVPHSFHDKPSVRTHGGISAWHRNGKLHREGAPALQGAGITGWFRDDVLHNPDGPAFVDSSTGLTVYAVNGVFHRSDDIAVVSNALNCGLYAVNGQPHRIDGYAFTSPEVNVAMQNGKLNDLDEHYAVQYTDESYESWYEGILQGINWKCCGGHTLSNNKFGARAVDSTGREIDLSPDGPDLSTNFTNYFPPRTCTRLEAICNSNHGKFRDTGPAYRPHLFGHALYNDDGVRIFGFLGDGCTGWPKLHGFGGDVPKGQVIRDRIRQALTRENVRAISKKPHDLCRWLVTQADPKWWIERSDKKLKDLSAEFDEWASKLG